MDALPAELHLIGSFAATIDGYVLDVKPCEQRVLAFIALQGRPVSRHLVAGTLWPELSDECALRRLRTGMWRCRQQIGSAMVGSSPTNVWLNPWVVIDVAALSRRMVPSGDDSPPEIAADELAHDLLEDWYDEWLTMDRERFRQFRLHALDLLCDRLIDQGRFGEALEAGLIAVAAEPLRESAHRLIVRAHRSEGNLTEALREYYSYRDMLRTELGIDPSPSMDLLISDLVVAAR
jgi:DNA-binding SARP family transcriptional activator